jgi:transmembrane sensor
MMNEEIHNLLGRYFSGEATAAEKVEVEEWIRSDEHNAAEFRLLENMWSGLDQPLDHVFDTGKAWQKVNAALQPAQPAVVRRISFSRYAIAAAACLVLAFGIWWMTKDPTLQSITATADAQEVTLPDGSHIYLRKGSRLDYPVAFNGSLRSVKMEGEAFFDITKDPKHPFVIEAQQAWVQVLGTSFTVSTKNKEVLLMVKTGLVRFGPGTDTARFVLVNHGEKARLADTLLEKSGNPDPNFNAWQSHRLEFQNTPLQEVATALSNTYGIQVVLKSEDAGQLKEARVTTSFTNQSLEKVLQELSLITSYRIQKTGEGVYQISFK